MAPTLPQIALINIRAQNFMNTHTTVVPTHELSLTDECTICLEDYTSERPIRITEIEGCAHVIGQECLSNLLAKEPEKTKKCPLCRTVWIQGNEHNTAPNGTRLLPTDQRSWSASSRQEVFTVSRPEHDRLRQRQEEQTERREYDVMLRDHESVRLRANRGRHASQGQRHGPLAETAVMPPPLVTNHTTNVGVGVTQQNPYELLTQDIESIRARAASTLPRRSGYGPWRRQQAARPLSAVSAITTAVPTAISNAPTNQSLEPRSEEELYEQSTRAIQDVRARAARTRPSIRVRRRPDIIKHPRVSEQARNGISQPIREAQHNTN